MKIEGIEEFLNYGDCLLHCYVDGFSSNIVILLVCCTVDLRKEERCCASTDLSRNSRLLKSQKPKTALIFFTLLHTV